MVTWLARLKKGDDTRSDFVKAAWATSSELAVDSNPDKVMARFALTIVYGARVGTGVGCVLGDEEGGGVGSGDGSGEG